MHIPEAWKRLPLGAESSGRHLSPLKGQSSPREPGAPIPLIMQTPPPPPRPPSSIQSWVVCCFLKVARTEDLQNNLNQVVASSGFSEKQEVGTQSRGVLKPSPWFLLKDFQLEQRHNVVWQGRGRKSFIFPF